MLMSPNCRYIAKENETPKSIAKKVGMDVGRFISVHVSQCFPAPPSISPFPLNVEARLCRFGRFHGNVVRASNLWCVCSSSQETFRGCPCAPAPDSGTVHDFLWQQRHWAHPRRLEAAATVLMQRQETLARQMQGKPTSLETRAMLQWILDLRARSKQCASQSTVAASAKAAILRDTPTARGVVRVIITET